MDAPDYLAPGQPDIAALDAALAGTPRPAGGMDFSHGDPVAFLPPEWALPTLTKSIEDGQTAYTPYRGDLDVRQSLSSGLSRLLGIEGVDPHREVVVTPGTQAGLFAALSSLVGRGDTVLVADPDYFASQRIVRYLGGHVIPIPMLVSPDGAARLDLERVRDGLREDPVALLFSNPNNPTGGVVDRACLAELAGLLEGTRTTVIVDELYCRLLYTGTDFAHLIAEPGMRERCVTLLGPSKTESMSGYRLGTAVGPAHVIDRMEAVLSIVSLRAPGYSQPLLHSWLDIEPEWLETRAREHQELRDLVIGAFRSVPGVQVSVPRGGSYVFPDVSGLGLTDFEAARRLRAEAGIVVNPGYQFGERGHGRFRINYSQDRTGLVAALAAMTDVLGSAG
jgi:aspartate/methionine/tyrosine aminotransferase